MRFWWLKNHSLSATSISCAAAGVCKMHDIVKVVWLLSKLFKQCYKMIHVTIFWSATSVVMVWSALYNENYLVEVKILVMVKRNRKWTAVFHVKVTWFLVSNELTTGERTAKVKFVSLKEICFVWSVNTLQPYHATHERGDENGFFNKGNPVFRQKFKHGAAVMTEHCCHIDGKVFWCLFFCGFKVLILSVRFISSTVSLWTEDDERFLCLLFSSWQAVPLPFWFSFIRDAKTQPRRF